MADHAKPILTDNYTDVLSQIRGRFEDQAKGFDPANTTPTNITTGTIRWNSAEKKFQKWSGTAWGDLTDNYVLSGATFSTGTANGVAYLNGSKVLTTGSALTFDGTNLGIGATPSYAVDIRNAPSTALRVGSNVNTFGSLLSWDNPSGTGRLWTLGAYDFVFGVNSTEQMRLTSTGLGIGTSSPGYKLDVAGDVRSERWIGRINTSPPTADAFIYRPADNSLGFGTANTERMRLDANGNVGIGTTNTSGYKLAVKSGTKTLYFTTDATTGFAYCDGNYYFGTTGADVVAVVTNNTERVRINASGNLLVGNTNGTSRITASGVIESTTGGFKFPDGTTQTTAAINPATVAVGAVGSYAMLINQSTNVFGIGDTTSGTNLWFSNADGTMTGNSPTHGPFGQWRCMGRCNSNVAGNTAASRVTTWLRIS